MFNRWAGAARWCFNKAIEALEDGTVKANWKAIKTEIIHSVPDWAKTVPYQIKSIAVRDACRAVSAAKKKARATGQYQRVRFRAKRSRRDSIFIPKRAVFAETVYPTITGSSIQPREPLPIAKADCRLQIEYGKYYLVLPVHEPKTAQDARGSIVALDPGVRTFQAFYAPETAGNFGAGDFGRIYRLCSYLDRLQSKIRLSPHSKRLRLRKAAARIRERIQSLIAEIHWKTARWLCSNFKVILIPVFETSKMVTRLRSKTARAMLTWAHFQYRERLIHKARELGALVLIVTEEYTSKTCSACGKIQNIGSKKMMVCTCGAVLCRDINGARGSFLKNVPALVDSPLFFAEQASASIA